MTICAFCHRRGTRGFREMVIGDGRRCTNLAACDRRRLESWRPPTPEGERARIRAAIKKLRAKWTKEYRCSNDVKSGAIRSLDEALAVCRAPRRK